MKIDKRGTGAAPIRAQAAGTRARERKHDRRSLCRSPPHLTSSPF